MRTGTRIYRTGSNIPVKDYGAANIEVGKPDAADPLMRPGTRVLGRKPVADLRAQNTAPAPPSIGTIAPVT
jgi:hypothetical protein